MDLTFRYRVGIRNTALVCLPGFVGMAVLSVFGAADARPDRQLIALVAFETFWMAWVALSTWLLCSYYFYRLQLSNDVIVEQSLFRKRTIAVREAVAAKWRVWPRHGSVMLKSPSVRIAVDFGNFEPTERAAIIRYVRELLPQTIQQDWPRFCQAIAVPLISQRDDRDPGIGEVRITRRSYDRWFLVGTFAAIVVSIWAAWIANDPKLFASPAVMICLWAAMRLSLPSKGMVSPRLASEPGSAQFLKVIAAVILLMLVGFWGIEQFNWPPMQKNVALAVLTVCFLTILLWNAHVLDKRRRQRKQAETPQAELQWEAAENADEL